MSDDAQSRWGDPTDRWLLILPALVIAAIVLFVIVWIVGIIQRSGTDCGCDRIAPTLLVTPTPVA